MAKSPEKILVFMLIVVPFISAVVVALALVRRNVAPDDTNAGTPTPTFIIGPVSPTPTPTVTYIIASATPTATVSVSVKPTQTVKPTTTIKPSTTATATPTTVTLGPTITVNPTQLPDTNDDYEVTRSDNTWMTVLQFLIIILLSVIAFLGVANIISRIRRAH